MEKTTRSSNGKLSKKAIGFIVLGVAFLLCCCASTLIVISSDSFKKGQEDASKPQDTQSPTNTPTNEPTKPDNTSTPTPTPTNTPVPKQEDIKILDLMEKPMSELTNTFSTALDSSGDLSVDNDRYKIRIERKKEFVTIDGKYQVKYFDVSGYIEIKVKELGECKDDKSILDHVDTIMNKVSLDPSKKGNPTNPQAGINIGTVEYGNYPSKYKISIFGGSGCYASASVNK